MSLEWLNENKCPFDTVDGTSWIGGKTGHTFVIDDNEKIRKIKDDRDWRTITRCCFDTWNDFSRIKEKSK